MPCLLDFSEKVLIRSSDHVGNYGIPKAYATRIKEKKGILKENVKHFNHLHPLTPKLNLDTTTSPRFTLCRSQMGVTAGFYV